VKFFFSRDYVMDKISLDRFFLSNPLILQKDGIKTYLDMTVQMTGISSRKRSLNKNVD